MMSSVCLAWVLLMPALLASSALAKFGEPPLCSHPRCKFTGGFKIEINGDFYEYEVEGNKLVIYYNSESKRMSMECNGASVLESSALPRAEPTMHVEDVMLDNCPLPDNSSLKDTLAAINVLCGPPCSLDLISLPAGPPLTASHFNGLEHLKGLSIRYSPINLERGFLAPLTSLVTLRVWQEVTLPAGELDASPPSLTSLDLHDTGVERLPEAVYSSTNLRELRIKGDGPLDAGAVPPGLRKLELMSSATTLQLDTVSALETLQLHNWMEPLPPPLARCDALEQIHLTAPAMRALPDGWLANCSRLEELVIEGARNLTTLPSKLFSVKTSRLTRIAFKHGALQTLDTRMLVGLDRLQSLEFNDNQIQNLPWVVYQHDALAHAIVVFTELDLSHNPLTGDVCNSDGDSRLGNLSNIRKLILRGTGVSRICRDWREKMPRLELLDLRDTRVSELAFQDLQYTRTVQAQVLLRGAPVAAVHITREDYNKAALAPPSFTSVDTDAELHCDCRMYWARRALDHPRAQLSLPGISELHCVGGWLLRDVPAEELVCEAREECVAAALPEEWSCTACPDDDPRQDQWLVRADSQNSSLGFVPRRTYPFYPIYQLNNRGSYLTQSIASMN